jgi:hypothetical protein
MAAAFPILIMHQPRKPNPSNSSAHSLANALQCELQCFLYFCKHESASPAGCADVKELTSSTLLRFFGSNEFVAPINVCDMALLAPIAGLKMIVGALLNTAFAAPPALPLDHLSRDRDDCIPSRQKITFKAGVRPRKPCITPTGWSAQD